MSKNMAEGSIIIETELDASKLKDELEKVKKLAADAGKDIEKALGDKAEDAADKAADGINEAGEAAQELGESAQKASTGMEAASNSVSELGEDAKKAAAGMKNAGDSAKAMGEGAKSAGTGIKGISGNIGALLPQGSELIGTLGSLAGAFGLTMSAASLAKKVLKAVAESIKECINSAMKFESAIIGVYKTVDASPEQLKEITQGIRNLSTEIPATAEDIAGVAEAAGQLGISSEDILDFTRVMIDLGEATNLSADDAASALAKFANITKMDPENYDRLGSTIVALGNNFATTESDIVNMMTRLASTGAVVGLSEAEMAALATALSSVGIEAEAGGTAISTLLKEFEKASMSGSKSVKVLSQTGKTLRELERMADSNSGAFKALAQSLGYTSSECRNMLSEAQSLEKFADIAGMSADAFASMWDSAPLEAMNAFISGLGELSENGGDALGVLEELGLTDVRLSNAILALASSNDILGNTLKTSNDAWRENNALSEEAEKRYGALESKVQMAKNSVQNLKSAVGDIFSPSAKVAADNITALFDGIGGFFEKNSGWMADVFSVGSGAYELLLALGSFSTGLWPVAAALGIQGFTQIKDGVKGEGKTTGSIKDNQEKAAKRGEHLSTFDDTLFGDVQDYISISEQINNVLGTMPDIEGRLAEAGYTVSELCSQMQSFAQISANAFSVADAGSAQNVLSLSQMMDNLNANQEAMRSWGDNMEELAVRMRDMGDGGDYIVSQFREMGLAGAAQLDELMRATDEQLRALADKTAEGLQLSVEVGLEVTGATTETELEAQLAPIKNQLEGYKKLFESGLISEVDYNAMAQPLLDQIDATINAAGDVETAVTDELSAALAAATGMQDDFSGLGAAMIGGIASGILANQGDISSALISALESSIAAGEEAMEINSPSKLTKRELGRPIIEGVGVGIAESGINVSRQLKRTLYGVIGRGQGVVLSEMRASSLSLGRDIGERALRQGIYSSDSHNVEQTQTINFYQPVASPAETARRIKQVQKELARNG